MRNKNIIRKIGKRVLFIIGGIVGLFLILFLVIRLNSSGTQEQFYDEDGKILTNSIAMHEDKVINGVVQRITVRGKDMNNPVLLRVHGGPGSFFTPFTYRMLAIDLEDIFTVCYWDQRGSGPASTREIPMETINLEQIVEDGLEVTKFLKEKFKKDKIYIEGISWGSTVSSFMVQKNPEHFEAYIGIGQMANQTLSEQLSYDFVRSEAVLRKDTVSLRLLDSIGRPPYPNRSNAEMAGACDIERAIVSKYVPMKWNISSFEFTKTVLLNDGWTFKEKKDYMNGTIEEWAYIELWPTCFNINLMRDVPEWKIPVYIMHGDNDHYTETSLAKQYFDSIQAPLKKWFLFENATHAVNYEYPEKYRSLIVNEILAN